MKFLVLSLMVMGFSSAARANEGSDGQSRAFQMARRVANFENERDLPSRAVWLGSRVARNARNLASYNAEEAGEKPAKKHSKTAQE